MSMSVSKIQWPMRAPKEQEKIVTAASRLSAPGHKAIAAQNGNFWAVSSQAPDGKLFSGQTRNASIRNGKIVTECNMGSEMAFGGPLQVTGLMGISPEKEIYIDYCQPTVVMRINNGIALYTVSQCNKGVHPDEIGIYNSFYGADTKFRPISADLDASGFYQLAGAGMLPRSFLTSPTVRSGWVAALSILL